MADHSKFAKKIKKRLAPDVISFTSSMSACGKATHWKRALHMLGDLSAQDIEANETTFGAVIRGCERDGKWQAAVALLEDTISFFFG